MTVFTRANTQGLKSLAAGAKRGSLGGATQPRTSLYSMPEASVEESHYNTIMSPSQGSLLKIWLIVANYWF